MNASREVARLYQLARIVRSKNAGPFFVTVDIFFRTKSAYDYVKERELITTASVAAAYEIAEDRVKGVYFWDLTWAVKVTMHRAIPAGGVGDVDCYGAAQHIPLVQMELPPEPDVESLIAEPVLATS